MNPDPDPQHYHRMRHEIHGSQDDITHLLYNIKLKLNVVVTWMSHIMHDCANEYYNLVYCVEHLLHPRPFQKIGSRLKSKNKV